MCASGWLDVPSTQARSLLRHTGHTLVMALAPWDHTCGVPCPPWNPWFYVGAVMLAIATLLWTNLVAVHDRGSSGPNASLRRDFGRIGGWLQHSGHLIP